jgi:glycosyltransferase involved in cell wall biosynthesis
VNILFLTLLDFSSLKEKGIYTDLLSEFVNNDHQVCVISPKEKRFNQPTHMISFDSCKILKLRIGNVQKTNLIEKGISTLLLEQQFVRGLKKYFNDVKFDLVLYSTPPITFRRAVKYIKKRDGARTYLLLKDIFPQNAVDLNILNKKGFKRFIYSYFRKKEKKLYEISDYIGCMSQANVDYVLRENPEISAMRVEICPNSISPIELNVKNQSIKLRLGLPENKTIYIYGGNIGKPQGVDFIINCLRSNSENDKVYFLIVGSGTEFKRLKSYIDHEKPANVQIISQIPKDEFEELVRIADVGLIFIDHRFTIPNFPSRFLSYMQASIPVLAATDRNTDLGKVLEDGKFGYWCESNNVDAFNHLVGKLSDKTIRSAMGINARNYLEKYYTVKQSYEIIMSHFEEVERRYHDV